MHPISVVIPVHWKELGIDITVPDGCRYAPGSTLAAGARFWVILMILPNNNDLETLSVTIHGAPFFLSSSGGGIHAGSTHQSFSELTAIVPTSPPLSLR